MFNEAFKDFRSAIEQGKQPSRNYTKENTQYYNPERARFKLVVWFKDGRSCWYYSYDSIHNNKLVHQDEWQSIKKLIRLAEVKFQGQYKNAILYANLTEDKLITGSYNYEVIKWDYSGNQRQNKMINFVKSSKTKDVLFDFQKMLTFGNPKI